MDENIFHRVIRALRLAESLHANEFELIRSAVESVYGEGWSSIYPEIQTSSSTIEEIMRDEEKFELVKAELIKMRLSNGRD